jgi:hypothetical protein
MGTIVIREYEQRFMADAAKGLLDEAEIPAMLASDDAGGSFPQLGLTGGYRILVHEEQKDKAEEILAILGEYTPPQRRGLFS